MGDGHLREVVAMRELTALKSALLTFIHISLDSSAKTSIIGLPSVIVSS